MQFDAKINKNVTIPYGNESVEAKVPDRVIFDGAMQDVKPLESFDRALMDAICSPTGCQPLGSLLSAGNRVLILIEDNTRNTPVDRILPVLIDYLYGCGIDAQHIEILTAPGTHRIMTNSELMEKVGQRIFAEIKITQHDFSDTSSLADLGDVWVGNCRIPVSINKKALEADFIIGLGNIVPHCDAGFSGGAKIVQPGICGYATTAATHAAAALLDEIPLGAVENPCRMGMERVAAKIGLGFIINTVMNHKNEVIAIVAGDFIAAHRKGAEIARAAFGVRIPEPADIVIVSSYPADIDYWQAEKGIISAYFAVKKNGIIIFVSPCPEGLAHNHPKFRQWLNLSYRECFERIEACAVDDESADLVSADLAICNSRVREKATILAVSHGLAQTDMRILGYRPFSTLQDAVDFALSSMPSATIGILPRGGDCLPIVS